MENFLVTADSTDGYHVILFAKVKGHARRETRPPHSCDNNRTSQQLVKHCSRNPCPTTGSKSHTHTLSHTHTRTALHTPTSQMFFFLHTLMSLCCPYLLLTTSCMQNFTFMASLGHAPPPLANFSLTTKPC